MEELNKTHRTWEHLLASFKEEIHKPRVIEADTPIERIKILKNLIGMVIRSSSVE